MGDLGRSIAVRCLDCQVVLSYAFNLLSVFQRRSETLFGGQFRPGPDVVEAFCLGGRSKLTVDDVGHTVIRNEMMCDSLDRHAHGLLDEAVRFEAIRVNQ